MKRQKIILAFSLSLVAIALIVAIPRMMRQSADTEKRGNMLQTKNRLAQEKSPYLLQHADNPVNWYPWGTEAFEKAKREDKPIFLSIGYSTCHWCHVMEQESFADIEVAQLMNEAFVSIKVDREERPDLDNVYMTVSHLMTGSGGWPLTIIMTPDKVPFFAGTYFPKKTRFERVGMLELLPRLSEFWKTRREEALKSANQVISFLNQMAPEVPGDKLGEANLHTTYEHLSQNFDEQHGGFGTAPKFPTPHQLLFLLRYWKRTGKERALAMVEKTLKAMQNGGLHDHVGFGFHRYATDPEWLLPHFEKMLYDQALLAMTYVEGYQATKKQEYAETAKEIFTYILRDMASPEGGFYSAEDADSEGEEGKFYLWTPEELQKILGEKEGKLIAQIFHVKKEGNFTEQATGKKTGTNILYRQKSFAEMAQSLNLSEENIVNTWNHARTKLFETRKKRIHPYKDDKILTDWNGLMIAALARGARILEEPRYVQAASRACDFILSKLRLPQGRLLHRYREGEAAIIGNLDDYAFLIQALLELYETTFEVRYLKTALELNKNMLAHFWDQKSGGLYFTADDVEELFVRKKEIYDGALPSGNSVATLNLLRLARMTANSDLENKAADIGRLFSKVVQQSPTAYAQLMVAVDFAVGPSFEIVIAGKRSSKETEEILKTIHSEFLPNKVILFKSSEERKPEIVALAPYTEAQTSIDGKTTVYVCSNFVCKKPEHDAQKILNLLSQKSD